MIPVGYARYSTDKQTTNSIAYQKEAILAFCKENDLELQRLYIDEATTGTNTNRAGLQQLIFDAKQGLFNAVVIYDISRGSRDVGDWFTFRSLMAELGVRVIAVSQELGDITKPGDFIKEVIEVGFAQYQVLDAREKSMAGSRQRAKKAKFMGGTPPLGYDVKDGHYVINEIEARWVKTIFEMYADGASYAEILSAIPEARSKLGRPLAHSSLHDILKNERYAGVYTWSKRIMKRMGKWAGGQLNRNAIRIDDAIPAIISKKTWEKAKRRMSDNARGGRNAAKREYLLSGLIECELCGTVYHGRTVKNTRGYGNSHYVCGNKYVYRQGVKRCTKSKNINGEKIETFVIESLKDYLGSADLTKAAQEIAVLANSSGPDLQKEKAELKQIETQINNGMKAILDGMYFPELQERMDHLRTRKTELENIIRESEMSRTRVTESDVMAIFREAYRLLEAGTAKPAIQQHVTKIIAHADGSCTVHMGVCLTGCGGAKPVVHTTYTFKAA